MKIYIALLLAISTLRYTMIVWHNYKLGKCKFAHLLSLQIYNCQKFEYYIMQFSNYAEFVYFLKLSPNAIDRYSSIDYYLFIIPVSHY
jgi:hypothetical protein